MTKYETYRSIFKNESYPLAYIDLELFEKNVDLIKKRTNRGQVRIASKSVRCVKLLRRILDSGLPFKGIMSFSINETLILSQKGFDDILMGYPSLDKIGINQLAKEIKTGKFITLMVDCKEHLELINEIGRKHEVKIPVCIDIDLSSDFPGLHFGVWRSPINSLKKLDELLSLLKSYENINLEGLMGYEAQIAGIGDKNRNEKTKNAVIKLLKKKSIKLLKHKRKEAVNLIKNHGFNLRFVNGGGTGSIESTLEEHWVTEVTVGSGFYQPHLFDNYEAFSGYPAAGFGVQICRSPKNKIYTCHGGGYIASGGIEKLKLPQPYLPEHCTLNENEGAGEVQTPIHYSGNLPLEIGDPLFFRHAKAGELCERFNQLFIVKGNEIVEKVNTYRGDGYCFL